ncbi:MAG: UDP-N-acetylmuramoyl-tripeptide--D-alanyl-D-alanine ligase [Hyphomicrobiales bacterium]
MTTAASPWLGLGEVARVVGGAIDGAAPGETAFTACAIDSRALEGGELFVPLPGTRADGHAFVPAALEAGALGSLVGRDYAWPAGTRPAGKPLVRVDDPLRALQALGSHCRERSGVPAVGITGSNGKTTTKEMIAAVLGTARRVHKNAGNLNNHIGVPLSLTRLRPEHDVIVMEMGMSAPGEIRELAAMVRPSVGVLTIVAAAHLLQLGSLDAIADAKCELADAIPADGLLVVNGDDPYLVPRARTRPARKRFFALDRADADLRPADVRVTAEGGTRFTLPDGTGVALALLGRHNVRNALAAILVGDEFGIPRARAAAALGALRPTKHRLELLDARGIAVLDDAYNANPASMKAALELLDAIETRGERRAVLGDMLELGPSSAAFHEEVGRAVPKTAWLYAAGEFAAAIERGARAAGVPAARARRFADVPAMAAAVVADARPGDLVLVKASRGMRLEQVVDALIGGGAGASSGLARAGRN